VGNRLGDSNEFCRWLSTDFAIPSTLNLLAWVRTYLTVASNRRTSCNERWKVVAYGGFRCWRLLAGSPG
jgi:hypothetical protein